MRNLAFLIAVLILSVSWMLAQTSTQDNPNTPTAQDNSGVAASSNTTTQTTAPYNTSDPDFTAADLWDSPPSNVDAATATDPNVADYANPTGLSVASTTGVSTDETTGQNAQTGSNWDPDQVNAPAIATETVAAAPPPEPAPAPEANAQPEPAPEPQPEPPAVAETTPPPPPAPEPAPEPQAQAPEQPAPQQLPKTASPLPLLGLLGVGSFAAGAVLRKRKK